MSLIRKLEESVVNRIAAGEVVQRPAAAIKELLENALDAGATQIAVTVKGGGLTLLQIQDNGHGIHRDDLAIVCERFTTSKLSNYEDLKSISTFGFRGEALASITHVAHVSILSKTANSNCAYKAKYSDGRLMPIPGSNKADPKPCAGNDGTTITVEDLFYNMSVRKQAFKNSSEEYLKILEVMTKYSVHYGNKGVTITCKKQGQSVPDLHTAGTSSTKEVIKMVYGAQIHRELLHLAFHIRPQESAGEESISDGNSSLEVEVDGFITSANYSSKKGIYVFFINNRLVDCPSIKKVCDAAYSEILPKYAHPFIYLNLRMPPHHLDVNVHPTKKEVHFLNEDELLIRIHRSITEVLKGSNESRTFAVANNSSLDSFMLKESTDDSNLVEHDENVNNFTDASTEYAPQKVRNENMIDRNEYEESEEIHSDGFIADDTLSVSKSEASLGSKRKLIFAQSESVVKAQPYRPNKLVRTDPTLVAIDSIFRPVPKERFKESAYEDFNIKMVTAPREREETVLSNKYCLPCTRQNYNTNHGVPLDGPCICCIPGLDLPVTDRIVGSEVSNESSNIVDDKALEVFLLPETNCSFDSVRELLMHLKVHRSSKLKEILSQSTFVGAVDRCRSLVQFKTSLLMIDHEYLLNHLFYQLTLRQFGVMGRLQLATPVPIKNFVLIAINAVEDMKDSSVASSSSISAMDMEERKTMAETVQELLIEKSAMLDDYFAIKISEDGQLHYLPLLLPNYTPEPSLLPYFLLRLATEIDWDGEKQCFNSIAGTIAWYYSQLSDCGVDGESSTDNSRDSRLDLGQVKLSQSIRNSLFPAVKRYLFTPDLSGNDSVVVEVTTLEKLYKVFERC